MTVTAKHIKELWEQGLKGEVAKSFGRTLRDFGYSTLTDDWVKTEIERLYAGGEAHGGPSMFISGWLKDGVD